MTPRPRWRRRIAGGAIFFFRDGLSGALTQMTADSSPSQPVAYQLLKRLDPTSDLMKISTSQAEDLLKGDSAGDRKLGAQVLAHAIIEPGVRAAVLALLKPHLMGTDGRVRTPFIEAYAHWATAADVPELAAIVAAPAIADRRAGQEDAWAAATVGLARLDLPAAMEAIQSRSSMVGENRSIDITYRMTLARRLESIATGNGPNSAAAEWVLRQLDSNHSPPPLPPGFNLTPANPPLPANVPAKQA